MRSGSILFGLLSVSVVLTFSPIALAQNVKSASAHQSGGGPLIFTCKTGSGKVVEFRRAGNGVRYSYAKPGTAPDLDFTVPRLATRVEDSDEDGGGASFFSSRSVSVIKDGTTYTGWWSFHRGTQEEEAGIRVERGGKTLASTPCKSGINIDFDAY
jgi:hypothetical protein